MTFRILTVMSFAALLCSCASTAMTEADCRGTDWYKLGDRDARFYGIQPQTELYARECGGFGAGPDLAAYLEGWKAAYSEVQSKGGAGGGGY